MKKLLLGLLSMSWLVKASEEMESGLSEASNMMSDVGAGASDLMSSLSWKTKLMIYWASMSSMHKIIALILVVLAVLWIAHRLMHCRKGGSCSCGCGAGGCGCNKK
jgi:hypothetical protein